MSTVKKNRAQPFGADVVDSELFLIYVHKVGENSRSKYEYEFVFSVSPETAIGLDWEKTPDLMDLYSEGEKNMSPDEQFIDKIGKLQTKIYLETAYDEGSFRYLDAVYKIIALCWEEIDDYAQTESLPEDILVFHYGDSLESVKSKLFSKDLKLKFDV